MLYIHACVLQMWADMSIYFLCNLTYKVCWIGPSQQTQTERTGLQEENQQL